MLDLTQHPHRRFNLLNGSWVLVSPHRTERPWRGQVERAAPAAQPEYDPNCYLCPGNSRAGGARNPPYTSTFVFDNDFAAMLPATHPSYHPNVSLSPANPRAGGAPNPPYPSPFVFENVFAAMLPATPAGTE